MSGVQQYIVDKVDSTATYAVGGGLVAASQWVKFATDVAQLVALLIGIAVCGAKGYYDWCKHKRQSVGGKAANDG